MTIYLFSSLHVISLQSTCWLTLYYITPCDHIQDKPAVPKEYKAGYNGLNLYSAYFEAAIADKKLGISADKKANSEPVYTTWKSRGGNVLKHTIDYIFYQQDMAKVVGLLTIPSDKEVNQKTFYPGFEYPSDHVAIMAQFQI